MDALTTPNKTLFLSYSRKQTNWCDDLYTAALTIIAKVGILYSKLERDSQKKLLREMVERVVVNPEGTILRMELLPPFAYLKEVTDRVRQESEDTGRKTKTSDTAVSTRCKAGQCSSLISLGDPQVSGSEPLAPNLSIQNFAHYVELTAYPQRSALEPLLTERKG